MTGFFSNRWSKIGVGLVVFGWGPLFLILLLASIGLWPDSDPNPIGPGLLFVVTLVPALLCLGTGAYQTWRKNS